MRRRVNVTPLLPANIRIIEFESEWEGVWQRIPTAVAEQLEDVDVVVKFGMNFLRDPESIPSTYSVISYHHGASEAQRGRPAGFYELGSGEAVMGVTVQQLSNRLDGDRIFAKAYSGVDPTSLKSSYGLSNTTLGVSRNLPTNRHIFSAVAKMTASRLSRLFYGAFREKH